MHSSMTGTARYSQYGGGCVSLTENPHGETALDRDPLDRDHPEETLDQAHRPPPWKEHVTRQADIK